MLPNNEIVHVGLQPARQLLNTFFLLLLTRLFFTVYHAQQKLISIYTHLIVHLNQDLYKQNKIKT